MVDADTRVDCHVTDDDRAVVAELVSPETTYAALDIAYRTFFERHRTRWPRWRVRFGRPASPRRRSSMPIDAFIDLSRVPPRFDVAAAIRRLDAPESIGAMVRRVTCVVGPEDVAVGAHAARGGAS